MKVTLLFHEPAADVALRDDRTTIPPGRAPRLQVQQQRRACGRLHRRVGAGQQQRQPVVGQRRRVLGLQGRAQEQLRHRRPLRAAPPPPVEQSAPRRGQQPGSRLVGDAARGPGLQRGGEGFGQRILGRGEVGPARDSGASSRP